MAAEQAPKQPKQPRKKKQKVAAEGEEGEAAALPDDFAAALMAATMVRAPSAPGPLEQAEGVSAGAAPSQATAASGLAAGSEGGVLPGQPAQGEQQQQALPPQDVQQPAAAMAAAPGQPAAAAAAKPKLKIKLGGGAAPPKQQQQQALREPSRERCLGGPEVAVNALQLRLWLAGWLAGCLRWLDAIAGLYGLVGLPTDWPASPLGRTGCCGAASECMVDPSAVLPTHPPLPTMPTLQHVYELCMNCV